MNEINLKLETRTIESKIIRLPVKVPKQIPENFRVPRKVKKKLKKKIGEYGYFYWWDYMIDVKGNYKPENLVMHGI